MNAAPRDPDVQQTGMVTVRTVTLDGHLGDALFRLNVLVHFEVAKKRGWLERPEFSPGDRAADLWDGVAKMGEGPRRYQTSIKQGSKEWRVFAPYGDKPEYFEYYSNRINGVGWRRRFPSGIELKGVDLRDTVVDVGRDDITFDSCNLSAANLIAGQITASATLGVRLIVGSRALYYGRLLLRGCDLENADLSLALNTELYSYFESCNLSGAHFDFADLGRAEFRNSPTRNATFRNTILDRVIFDEISRPTDRPGPIVT